jgi:hypothetical protein
MKIVVSFSLMIVVENKLIIAKKTVDHCNCSIKQYKKFHVRYEESLIFDEEKKVEKIADVRRGGVREFGYPRTRGEGVKIKGKLLRTSFMDGPKGQCFFLDIKLN